GQLRGVVSRSSYPNYVVIATNTCTCRVNNTGVDTYDLLDCIGVVRIMGVERGVNDFLDGVIDFETAFGGRGRLSFPDKYPHNPVAVVCSYGAAFFLDDFCRTNQKRLVNFRGESPFPTIYQFR